MRRNNIEEVFAKLAETLNTKVPIVVAETAIEDFKENFRNKSFDGIPWKETKKPIKRGSLMVRTAALSSSIWPTIVTDNRVRITAGNNKVPYAKIHNDGGMISRASRSETFVRNRYKNGKKGKYFGGMGAFKKGTTNGKGLSFKAYSFIMPKRQFMGKTAALNQKIKDRIISEFKNRA